MTARQMKCVFLAVHMMQHAVFLLCPAVCAQVLCRSNQLAGGGNRHLGVCCQHTAC
jgi:hypothetical protein